MKRTSGIDVSAAVEEAGLDAMQIGEQACGDRFSPSSTSTPRRSQRACSTPRRVTSPPSRRRFARVRPCAAPSASTPLI